MRKRLKILIALFSLAVLAILFLLAAHPGEGPVYKGRHLSQWVSLLGENPEAEQAVRAIGTNAYPYLLTWLALTNTSKIDKLPPALRRFVHANQFLRPLAKPDIAKQEAAAFAFRFLSTRPSPFAIQGLAKLADDNSNPAASKRAVCCLADFGCAGAVPLARIIGHPAHPRHHLALTVVHLETRSLTNCGDIFVGPLVACLTNSDPLVVHLAADALGDMRADSEIAIPALAALMRDTLRPETQDRAIIPLSKLGAAAFPYLCEALADTNFPDRRLVVVGMTGMARRLGTNVYLPPIVAAMNDADPKVRKEAERMVGRLARPTTRPLP